MNKNIFTLFLLLVCGFVFLTISGCPGPEGTATDSPNEGTAYFDVRWPGESDEPGGTETAAVSRAVTISGDCQSFGVSTVKVTIKNSSGTVLLTPASFACSQGYGTVTNIPVGDNRTFVVEGLDSSSTVKYRGTKTGVSIRAGANDVGTIQVEPVACTDVDSDSYCAGEDCDDNYAGINPGATEVCGDDIDNDCDALIDEGCDECTMDTDGDGTANCYDECPNDPYKTEPGICGCGVAETECPITYSGLYDADGDSYSDDVAYYTYDGYGNLTQKEVDLDNDGTINYIEYVTYENGTLIREEYDFDGDGTIDHVVNY